MADSDKNLKINVEFNVNDSEAEEKTKLLEKNLEELNKISPGLGDAMNLLAAAYLKTATAAEGGAAGAMSFNTALSGVLRSLGPLTIALLGIQAATEYWDLYQEKVEAVARAQEEATKRIEESTHRARDAVQELEEAMKPRPKNLAEQDEEKLQQRLHGMDEAANRQGRINEADEQAELAGASSPDQKSMITRKYAALAQQLQQSREDQKAGIEGSAASNIEQQIMDTLTAKDKLVTEQARQYQILKQTPGQVTDLENQRAQTFTDIVGPQGQRIDTTDHAKVAAIDAKIVELKAAQATAQAAYDKAAEDIGKLKDSTGPLGEKRAEILGRSRQDASDASYHAQTNSQINDINKYGEIQGKHGGQLNETLGQLAVQTHKTHDQTVAIVKSILDGHYTFEQRMAQLEAQLIAQKNGHQN